MREPYPSTVLKSSAVGTPGALRKPRQPAPAIVSAGPAMVNKTGGTGALVAYQPDGSPGPPVTETIRWRNGLIITSGSFRVDNPV